MYLSNIHSYFSIHYDDSSILTLPVLLLSAACLTVSVTVFGIMIGEDRTWMPRFDINRLGWSFGLAVISGFFAVFATICLSVYTLIVRYYSFPPDNSATMGTSYGSKAFSMVPKA